MKYISTRGSLAVSAAEAIVRGLAPDGGLYVPSEIPRLSADELRSLAEASYPDAARMILGKYLDGFTADEIDECVSAAYESGAFASAEVAPLVMLNDTLAVMELFWGPTSAFKDVALQLMPRLLVKAARKIEERDKIAVVVATSGDTGKAALEGFCDVDGTGITVVYPADGVSELQRRQMVTQHCGNTRVIALDGNFDDAQTAVKQLFSDEPTRKKLAERGVKLSSANSINFGRLLPQIVYYSVAAVRLSRGGAVDFIVPTGNFGNILAAYYSKLMGAPIGELTVACNKNDVLADFIESGTYNRKRPFYRTLSPSMDILVSSNLERLLFELSGRDSALVKSYMIQLTLLGFYKVDTSVMRALRETFSASRCDDELTSKTIAETWREFGYLCDPHTATAFSAAYKKRADGNPAVVAATASPYKFPAAVYSALFGDDALGSADDYAALELLSKATETEIPAPLGELAHLPVRHTERCAKDALVELLAETL